MTDPTVTARPPYGSVESFARILRAGKGEYLDARALAIVALVADDASVDVELRVERIKNVISAAELVEKEADSRDSDWFELATLRAENERLRAAMGEPAPEVLRTVVDKLRADQAADPSCRGVPPGFEADCGIPGPHGPHGPEPLTS
jgi:hypothetical protein